MAGGYVQVILVIWRGCQPASDTSLYVMENVGVSQSLHVMENVGVSQNMIAR